MLSPSLHRRLFLRGALAFGLTLVAVGCNEDNPTAPVTEPPPDVPTVVETFNGELEMGDTSCHTFTTTQTGNTELSVTELEPLNTLTVGLLLGTPDATDPAVCLPFAQDNAVRLFEDFLSAGLIPGIYCACVVDVGNIFEGQTVTYTLTVEHP